MPCRSCRSGLSRKAELCGVALFFSFSLLSPNYAFFHKFPLKLLANGVICNTWYSSSSKPPPVYPGILLAPPAAKSCLQDTTRSAKSQPDSLHRPVFCKILLQGFAPPTIMYLWQYRIILSADTASEVRQMQANSADNTGCLLEHFGNADAVPQLPERCLSRKAELCGVALYIISKGAWHSRFPLAGCFGFQTERGAARCLALPWWMTSRICGSSCAA